MCIRDRNHIWLLWGAGIISAILVFLAAKNDYRKTYIASYKESNTTRLRIAEHLRKLPMSFFNTKDLSELTTNTVSYTHLDVYKRQCNGRGIVKNYNLFEGIQLCFLDFNTDETMVSKKFNSDIIQITHCRSGRYECEFLNHTCLLYTSRCV